MEDQIKLRLDNPKTCYVYELTSDTLHMHEEVLYLREQLLKYKSLNSLLNQEKKQLLSINNVPIWVTSRCSI
jgi:hypothetical protein